MTLPPLCIIITLKSYNNCMSLPQSPYLLTSRTCNSNSLLDSKIFAIFHRYLLLTGEILTQLFSEVLFFPGFYVHSPLSWQKEEIHESSMGYRNEYDKIPGKLSPSSVSDATLLDLDKRSQSSLSPSLVYLSVKWC